MKSKKVSLKRGVSVIPNYILKEIGMNIHVRTTRKTIPNLVQIWRFSNMVCCTCRMVPKGETFIPENERKTKCSLIACKRPSRWTVNLKRKKHNGCGI